MAPSGPQQIKWDINNFKEGIRKSEDKLSVPQRKKVDQMKKILFLTRSSLAPNLLQAVLPLVPFKVKLTAVDSLATLVTLPQKGKGFSLVLADLNALCELSAADQEFFRQTPVLKNTPRALFYPLKTAIDKAKFENLGFSQFYQKPFLPEQLAEIILKGCGE